MKKLIYLLVLSLCAGSMTGAASPWAGPALAEEQTDAEAEQRAAEEEAERQAAEEEAARQREAEEAVARKRAEQEQAEKEKAEQEKQAEKEKEKEKDKAKDQDDGEKKHSKKDKKEDREEREKEYALDMLATSEVLLSKALDDARTGVRLSHVKKLEAVNDDVNQYIQWQPVEKNSDDYIITVLRDFKEVRLRIRTDEDSIILVLKNGQKPAGPEAVPETTEENAAEGEQPSEETEQTEVEKETEEQTVEETVEQTTDDPAQAEEENTEAPLTEETPETEEAPQTEETEPTEEAPQTEKTEPTEEAAQEAEQAQTPEASQAEGSDQPQDAQPSDDQQSQEQQSKDQQSQDQQGKDQQAQEQKDQGQQDQGQQSQEQPAQGQQSQEQPAQGQQSQEQPAQGQQDQQAPAGEQPADGQQPQEQQSQEGAAEQQPAGEQTQTQTGIEAVATAEAWMLSAGRIAAGKLSEVLLVLNGGETVYIRSAEPLFVQGVPTATLSKSQLVVDSAVFNKEHTAYTVCVSQDNPAEVAEPRIIALADLPALGETADLWFWVKQDATQPGGDQGQTAPQIGLTATDYVGAAWSGIAPGFVLSGIPEGKNWSYAAIVYDERFIPMLDNIYIPEAQGQYTLRFAMMDEIGDVLSTSGLYTVWLDWAAPEEVSVEADSEKSYTVNITATDSISGVEAVSVDGGEKWHKASNGEAFTYSAKSKTTLEAGSVMVRDVAGNVWVSSEDYELDVAESDEEEEEDGEGGGGGGLGGGGGSGTSALSHASGDGEEGSEYDALLLDLSDEPMEQLTVGDEAMDLTLKLKSAQEPDAPVGENQFFTASLRRWNGSGQDDPDTLVLDAELDANLGDEFTYEWRFNGEVYRLLANSGIRYVALKVADSVAAFPTEGFTGGTKYTELKMRGVSTRRFEYSMAMRVNLNPGHMTAMSDSDYCQDCDLSIRTEVEDVEYELSNSTKSIMYYYNVFLGPDEMLNQPFGEYQARN